MCLFLFLYCFHQVVKCRFPLFFKSGLRSTLGQSPISFVSNLTLCFHFEFFSSPNKNCLLPTEMIKIPVHELTHTSFKHSKSVMLFFFLLAFTVICLPTPLFLACNFPTMVLHHRSLHSTFFSWQSTMVLPTPLFFLLSISWFSILNVEWD